MLYKKPFEEYYSAIKRNKCLMTATWLIWKIWCWAKGARQETICIEWPHLYETPEKGKSNPHREKFAQCACEWGAVNEEWGRLGKGDFQGWWECCSFRCWQWLEWPLHLKRVHFTVCKLYFNKFDFKNSKKSEL